MEPEATLDLARPAHVRAVYLDLVGRTPDADELVLAPQAGPARLLALLCASSEFWEHWYEDELYTFLLVDNSRPQTTPGEAALSERLARGELTLTEAVRLLVGGSAFHRANPGADTFVSVVLEQLLGLTVQDHPGLLEAGKRMYDGRRASLFGSAGDSQSDVVAIACAQPAFAERLVARQYERLVGRPAPKAELPALAAGLRAGERTLPDLAREWLASPAYAERLQGLRRKTDRQFLRGLLVDLTGAPPDPETEARARTALAAVADGGPLRSVLARVLLQRHGPGLPEGEILDAEHLVRSCYRRFLGRPPGPDELAAMVLAVEQGGATPELVVAALMTHWEYQYY